MQLQELHVGSCNHQFEFSDIAKLSSARTK
jgi:hypothetical protein